MRWTPTTLLMLVAWSPLPLPHVYSSPAFTANVGAVLGLMACIRPPDLLNDAHVRTTRVDTRVSRAVNQLARAERNTVRLRGRRCSLSKEMTSSWRRADHAGETAPTPTHSAG